MIKIEHVVLPSPEQMQFVIEGMRNPMNSWDRSDSVLASSYIIGENDENLMQRLANAGEPHRKYMRMMVVYARITAPLYWWKEFETYKVGTVTNSCSSMHKITESEFTPDDFSYEHLNSEGVSDLYKTIDELNFYRYLYLNYDPETSGYESRKDIWWQIIQRLPSTYNQTRNVMMSYEVLVNIYQYRYNHRLDEWCVHDSGIVKKDFTLGKYGFCDWIEGLPLSDLITEPARIRNTKITGWQPIEEYHKANEKKFGTYTWVLVRCRFEDHISTEPDVAIYKDGQWITFDGVVVRNPFEFFDISQIDNIR